MRVCPCFGQSPPVSLSCGPALHHTWDPTDFECVGQGYHLEHNRHSLLFSSILQSFNFSIYQLSNNPILPYFTFTILQFYNFMMYNFTILQTFNSLILLITAFKSPSFQFFNFHFFISSITSILSCFNSSIFQFFNNFNSSILQLCNSCGAWVMGKICGLVNEKAVTQNTHMSYILLYSSTYMHTYRLTHTPTPTPIHAI